MRWSELPPALRSHFGWLGRVPRGPRALPVAVAHLVLVRPQTHDAVDSYPQSWLGRHSLAYDRPFYARLSQPLSLDSLNAVYCGAGRNCLERHGFFSPHSRSGHFSAGSSHPQCCKNRSRRHGDRYSHRLVFVSRILDLCAMAKGLTNRCSEPLAALTPRTRL